MSDTFYDIIGDIHGHASALMGLLEKLGYRKEGECYRHPDRTAVFIGDFIDHGPDSREVLTMVRPMIEHRSALAVLGNHELNAVCFHTKSKSGEYLRPHTSKNTAQHKATLESFGSHADDLLGHVEWFKELPLYLDLPGFRVVHACWDVVAIAKLKNLRTLKDLGDLNEDSMSTPEAEAMKLLCKGHEIEVPGLSYPDKYGQLRSELRVAWWRNAANATCRQMAVKEADSIPEFSFPRELQSTFQGYRTYAPLLFIGHYSLDIAPAPLLPNLANVDLGVTAGRGLTAYRWNGESLAKPAAFVQFRNRFP